MIPSSTPAALQEPPPLEHRRDACLQARDRVAVVVRAEGEEREHERDLRQEEKAVLRLPEGAPGADLEVAVDDACDEQDDDRDDRHVREARDGPRGQRPAVLLVQHEGEEEEAQPAGPERGRDHVATSATIASFPAVLACPENDGVSDMTPPSASVSAASGLPVPVLGVPEGECGQRKRHGERGLEQHHLAVPRVDHVR